MDQNYTGGYNYSSGTEILHIIKSFSLEGKYSKGVQETGGRGMEAFP
jgi:hypothetical protein